MSKALYFIESASGTKNYDQTVGGFDSNYFYHTYNFFYQFKSPLQNIYKITLKSVELPLGASTPNNIRYNNGTQVLSFTYTISTYTNISKTVNVVPGSYSTIALLTTAINTAITGGAFTGSPTITFGSAINSTTGLTHCTITHNCTSLTINSTNITIQLLGLGTSNITSSTTINGTYPMLLYPSETLYYMQITNLPVMNNNIFPYTFKIPLNNIVNNTAYYSDTEDIQAIYFNKNPFVLDKLNVVIVDALGKNLTGYFHWTMTLKIEYDNFTQQEFLNFNN